MNKLYIVIISILISYTYSFNTEDIQLATEIYEYEKERLEPHQRNALNESCYYGGTTPAFGIEYEPLLQECFIIKYKILSYWYNNITRIGWQKIGDSNSLDERYIKNDKLWLPMLKDKNVPEEYICTLYGDKGCVQSVVSVYKISKMCEDTHYEIDTRKYFSIYCSVTSGGYFIEWYKDGKMINDYNSGKYKINGNRLIINKVVLEDAGKYTCRAYYHDKEGYDDVSVTKCINVAVYPPQNRDFDVSVDNPILKVKLGETANTTCTAVGKSNVKKPYVEWKDPYNNDKPLYYYDDVVDFHDSSDSTMLYFINVTEEFIGKTFTCEASHYDKVKTVTTKIELDI
ncbi:hypothetical protein Murmansk-189 [Murmansk poxvirus]|uniref:Ig-like domain-containing protein n=1 Tax=Murmansk poxvirus TaxID=2025359 RepID=A0A223FN20_9POXV|nr:hypothetical protein CKM52_gp189 [Murmansk poxvirus]AST09384.1 hypothetical protein Murmansk-189 [Murmansk poxvirus]